MVKFIFCVNIFFMQKKPFAIIPIILPAIIALGVIFFVQINRKSKSNIVPTPTPIINNNSSAQDINVQKSDAELIKDALVAKNNWNSEEIEITLSHNDGEYAAGGVGGETPQGGGGLWFAAKVNGNWQIVWDGNGIVMCENLTDYQNFPASLIPECYDINTNQMVKR